MPIITPTIPTIGQPNATEDVDVVSTLTALLNLVNGNLDASNILNGSITPAELGDIGHGDRMQTGVLGAGDAKVSAPGTMNVTVATGVLWVQDSNGLMQRMRCNGATLAVPTAHATLPRIDQVIATLTTPGAAATLSVLQGTPTATAQATDPVAAAYRTGAASLPVNSVRLADITVDAAAASIVAGKITDRRPWARGVYTRKTRTAGNLSTNSVGTYVIMSTPDLAPRIECSGVPMRVGLHGYMPGPTGAIGPQFEIRINGVAADAGAARILTQPSGGAALADITWDFVPAAGLKTIAPYWFTTAGANANFAAVAATPAILTVEELVMQNADNT